MSMSDQWLDAQNAVIGCVLIEPKLAARAIAETREDDYDGACRTIYNAICQLHRSGATVDPVSVLDAAGSQYREYIIDLMKYTPTTANFDTYLQICREQSRLTRLRRYGGDLAAAPDIEEAKAVISRINENTVMTNRQKALNVGDLLSIFMDRHSGTKPIEYLPWGLSCLDRNVYAELGDFIVIGGYRSDGKSALALQCGLEMAKRYKVGFFSLETSVQKFADRLAIHLAAIDATRSKNNNITADEWRRIVTAGAASGTFDFHFEHNPDATPDEVLATAQLEGYQIVIIDYLQLMTPPGRSGNRTEEVSSISRALHTGAQKQNICIIALSQLTRPERGKTKGEAHDFVPDPQLSDLRESGQIEQDADLVLFVHRPNPENDQRRRILRIAKQKDGELRRFEIDFDGRLQRFQRPATTGGVEVLQGNVPTYPHALLSAQRNRAEAEKSGSKAAFNGSIFDT